MNPRKYSPFNGRWGRNDNYATPKELYDDLDREFHFTYDPCPLNPKGLRERDGLGAWGLVNFVNPPYSNKEPWVRKAIEEQDKGHTTVMLLPSDTSTKLFHDLLVPNAEIWFLRGRLCFKEGRPAKFASMIAIFRGKAEPNHPVSKP